MQPKRLSKRDYFDGGRHIKADRRNARPFPLHSHDYFELEIVLGGRGIQYINSEKYKLERGSAYLLTPADFHEVIIEEEIELVNIVFDETLPSRERLQSIFAAKKLCRSVDETTLFKLERAAELIIAECNDKCFVEPLLEYMLEKIWSIGEGNEEITPIRRAMLYVENHFRDDPTLAQAAEYACLSPIYFGNLFKRITGETYISYLNRCKVNCAMMLLENGMSVAQAGFDSGFGSLSGFLYTFKQKTGMSPNEYRKKHMKRSI